MHAGEGLVGDDLAAGQVHDRLEHRVQGVGARQQDRELLATDPGDVVLQSDVAAQRDGEPPVLLCRPAPRRGCVAVEWCAVAPSS